MSRVEKVSNVVTNAVLVVGVLGILGLTAARRGAEPNRPPLANVPTGELIRLVDSANAATPVSDGKVSVMVVTDFQCPFCARLDRALEAFDAEHPGALSLSIVHTPITGIHPYALRAARAFECGVEQGAAKQLKAALYASQETFGVLDWGALGDSLPNPLAFRECVADTAAVARIEAGMVIAGRLGLDRTPIVLVNGQQVDPPGPAQVQQAIRDALK